MQLDKIPKLNNGNPDFKYENPFSGIILTSISCFMHLHFAEMYYKEKKLRKRVKKYKNGTSEKISPYYLSGLLSSRVLPAPFGNETSLLCEQKKEEKKTAKKT